MMSSDFRIVVTSGVRQEDGVWSRAHTWLEMACDLLLGLRSGFMDICDITVLYNIHVHDIYSHFKNKKFIFI